MPTIISKPPVVSPVLITTGDRHVCRGPNGVHWTTYVSGVPGAYELHVAYTDPNGATLLDEVAVSALTLVPGALAISVETSGQPVVCTVLATQNTVRCYSRAVSGAWTAATTWTFQLGSAACQSLSFAIDRADDWHCVVGIYRTSTGLGGFQYRTSANSGTSWSAATSWSAVINNQEHQGSSRCSLAVDTANDVHLLKTYRNASDRYILDYVKRTSGTWGSVETLESLNALDSPSQFARFLTIAVDQNDVPFIALVRPQQSGLPGYTAIFWGSRTGGGWGAIRQIHPSVDQHNTHPTLMLLGNGDTPQIAWSGRQAVATYSSIWLAQYNGATWTTPEEVAAPTTEDLVRPSAPHARGPTGDGYIQDGWLLTWRTGVGSPVASMEIGTVFHLSPPAAAALEVATAAPPAGNTKVGIALTKLFAHGAASEIGILHASAKAILQVTTGAVRESVPAATSLVVSTSVQLNGSIWNRSGSAALAVATTAVRALPALCETSYEPTPAIQADLNATDKVVLRGPFSLPTRFLNIRRPSLGEIREVDTGHRIQRSRAGVPQTWRVENQVEHRLRMSFDGVSRKKALEVEDFFREMRGRQFKFTDWELRDWRVFLLETDLAFVTNAVDFNGSFDVALQGVNV